MTLLERLRARIAEINAEIRTITETVERENRSNLTPEEDARYAELRTERDEAEERATQLEDEERRRQADAAGRRSTGDTGRAHVLSEPQTYGRGSGNSYFQDLARGMLRNDTASLARLQRHGQEMDVELREREARRAARAQRQLDEIVEADRRAGVLRRRDAEAFFSQESRAVSRTDGQGGYFVPPLWLIDEYIPALYNGRPFANQARQLDLPGGTDSINLPKVKTGTSVDVQQDNGAVSSTDITDDFVSAPVRTIAGQEDLPIQLLEQSPVSNGFDEVIIQDLLANYAQKVDTQSLSGTGANGQLKGITQVTGITTVTYTSASPTVAEAYPMFAQLLSNVQRKRKRKDGIQFFMQGPRWWWIASALDSQNRPLVPPSNAFNPLALANDDAAGPDGQILTRPVFVDLNITEADGAGTNQDQVYATRTQDLYLWEGEMRTRALQEVLSGTLQVRLQIYNYVALMPDRYPSSIAMMSGTGLVVPAGF